MEWWQGDLFEVVKQTEAQVIAFTANAVLKPNRSLICGAGAAKSVRDKCPGVDKALGEVLFQRSNKTGLQEDYYVIEVEYWSQWVMAVQTKRRPDIPKNKAEKQELWDLTSKSLEYLAILAKKHPERRIVLNCPLIGLGGFGDELDEVGDLVEEKLVDTNIVVCYL